MVQIILATLSPMLVLFFCMATGFALKKFAVLPDNAGTVLSKLENFVFVPSLVFSTFLEHCNVESIVQNKMIFVYSIVSLVVAMGLSYPLSHMFERKDAYKKNIYKYALAFGNFGFLGNAVVPAVLGGDEALYIYLLFTLPYNTAVYTWGVSLLIPKEHRSGNFLKNLINPVFISLAAGMVCGILGVGKYIPEPVFTVLGNFKACMAPVAMLLMGFIIGGYNFVEIIKEKKLYVGMIIRLFVLPAIICAVLYLVRADITTITMCLFATATPFGLNTVIFPAAYGGDTKPGAGMALISHTLCVISIPVMYAIFQAIFG